MVTVIGARGAIGAMGAMGLVLGACSCTPAGRERAHAIETLSGIADVAQVSVGCEGRLLAADAWCADVVLKEGATLRFEKIGYNAFGPNAVNVVVAEAGGLVPRIASCTGVTAPNFHREAALGHHFSPTLIDVKEAVSRAREVLEEVQFWPQCPQSWEVQDRRGVNYRYCARRRDQHDEPPRPAGCPP